MGTLKPIYYINDLEMPEGYHKFERHRTPHAYMELGPWYSVRWSQIEKVIQGTGNIIVVQTPTHDELEKLTKLRTLVESNKVFINQESVIYDWFDWPAPEQKLYLECLEHCAAFCYHNEYDRKVMEIFTDRFIKYPGCVNLFLPEEYKSFESSSYIAITGPFKRYQRGMVVHKLVHDVIKDQYPVKTMNYRRPKEGTGKNLSFPDSYRLGNMELTDFMPVPYWINYIYNTKFGIDIQRDFSCGNNCIEFGSLGVPLVGNINLDCQRDIFPDISFDYKDYSGIKRAIKQLHEDKDFYEEVSRKALINTKEKYDSVKVVRNFMQELNSLL